MERNIDAETPTDADAPADETNDTAPETSREDEATPEELLSMLVEGGVLVESEPDTFVTTDDYDATRAIYHDTYTTIPEAEFHESVAEVFGLEDRETAAERVAALSVTRAEFVAYLAIDSELDWSPAPATLARMARVVDNVEPGTPVPDGVVELDDESYRGFVEANERAIVTVWKRHCDPCEAMKDELNEILDAMPEAVSVGGLDGEQCDDFRRAYGIDAAPAMLLFENGEFCEGFTGRATAERVAAACAEVYGA